MILTSFFTLGLASLAQLVSAQDDTQGPIVFDAIHNATTIYGTWSTGSRAVSTGPVGGGPSHQRRAWMLTLVSARASLTPSSSHSSIRRTLVFHIHCEYPLSCHIQVVAHLFPSSRDGFYEIARYRFNSNGAWLPAAS